MVLKYREYDGTKIYEIIQPDTVIGFAQAGTGTTITLSSDSSSVDGAYVGYTIYISSGTNSGDKRVVEAYDGTTKIATVSAWTVTPDDTSNIYMTNIEQGTLHTDDTANTKCYAPSYLDFNNTFKGLNNVSSIASYRQLTLT